MENEKQEIVIQNPEKEEKNENNNAENNKNKDLEDKEKFDDSSDENGKKDPNKEDKEKKVQTPEERAKFAQLKREKEQKEAERLERIKQEAYEKGLVEAVDGINPYTKKEIKTQKDVKVFLNMRALSQAGLDPIADYYMADEIIEKNQNKANRIDPKEDIEDFQKNYPSVSIDELNKDARFMRFAKGKVGVVKLSEIYTEYKEFMDEIEAEIDNKAKKLFAKAKASPGAAENNAPNDSEFYTHEQIKKMSQKEIHDNYDKVLKSLRHNQKK